MPSLPDSGDGRRSGFRQIAEAFLSQPGLPFTRLLSAERIERVFAEHGNLFGGAVYSTAMMVWSFLGQVLRDGKEASCQAAVARVVAHQQLIGGAIPTADTGDYCRARAKLSEAALHALTVEVGAQAEQEAKPDWLWKNLHAKLVDGFTFTMPDTPANQAAYPQPNSQKPGLGFPMARACEILSLATGCGLDLAIGPYSGKETGETALLRGLLGSFSEGDLLVADRYYCSFLMIALLLQRQVDVCVRLHQRRRADFRRGRRLGPDDHLIMWTKPPRPEWMDEETYAAIPETLTLREIRYRIVVPGRRVQLLTVVTTLLDAEVYSRQDIAELYRFRWNSELDIRSIKQTLNLSHVRCKSPEMVRRELWATLLAYNLVRTTAAAAAALHDKRPRQISFTGACQYVLASWSTITREGGGADEALRRCQTMLEQIAQCEVANRPGRIEPRELKRRRHGYKLMEEPRATLRARLAEHN
ncbi:MAG: IS4 family transposase [Gammaproteobacteria bacterium]